MNKTSKFSVLAAGSAAALFLSCLSAAAIESRVSAMSSHSVAVVWHRVGDFCGIANWLPPVAKCTLQKKGRQRMLSLKGGGTIIEHLVRWSNKHHRYTYRILKSPLPVSHYISTISVTAHGKGSVVEWVGHYKAKGATNAAAKKTIDGIYKAGVDSLAK